MGDAPPNGLAIEVVNLSAFPVTISEIGLRRVGDGERVIFANPRISEGKKLPLRMEPRSAVTAYMELPQDSKVLTKDALKAFAATECGKVEYGTSPMFLRILKYLRTGEDWSNR